MRKEQDLVGVPANTFTLLGIQYNLARPSACVDAEIVSDSIQRRCLKIRLAAQHLGTRIVLVHQLVFHCLLGPVPFTTSVQEPFEHGRL